MEVYQSNLTHPWATILYQPSTAITMPSAIRSLIDLNLCNDHSHHLIHLMNGYRHYFHLAKMA